MEFEYDPKKSEINKRKHGIDFEEAKVIWDDPMRLELQAKTVDEQRSVIIGKIENKYFSAIIAYRNNKTRIISVRRSRDNEVMLYES